MSDPPKLQGKDLQNFKELPRSALASYVARAAEDQKRFHYTLSALEPHALWQWITEYIGNRLGPRHEFNTYEKSGGDNGIYKLGDDSLIGGQPDPNGEIRISIAGDWGTGTDESAEVAAMMTSSAPHYTIHLGDVYYVGRVDEVKENCLGQPDPDRSFIPCCWPIGSVGSFALNGNHEMYALGEAFFDVFLPALGLRPSPGSKPLGQKASFFCLENDFWRVIGLDTGYNSIGIPVLEYIFSPSCNLRKEELEWLQNKVNAKGDKRGLILLTHHQYCSAFDQEYPKAAQQLSKLIDRPVLWLWGHEHRMTVYGKYVTDGGIQAYGRCIGHGGMPVGINNRQYPSPENIIVGYNGFANLIFKGNQLMIEYRDLKNTLLLTENWQVDSGILKGKAIATDRAAGLTQQAELSIAIS